VDPSAVSFAASNPDSHACSGDVRAHIDAIEADLVQAASVIARAVEVLGDSFLAVADTVARQQALCGGADRGEDMAALRNELAGHVAGAVTALQFEDIARQLIARAVERAGSVRLAVGHFPMLEKQ
jgi:hypothetical protein